ncbi:MAG: hypothetical protein ABJZ55_16935 [Fuerstiella sp.]
MTRDLTEVVEFDTEIDSRFTFFLEWPFLLCSGDLMHRYLILVFVVFLGAFASADTPVRQRAIDVVLLDNGTRLLGVVMPSSQNDSAASQDVRVLLRADWLKKNSADFYAEVLELEADPELPGQPKITLQSLLEDRIKQLQTQAEPDVQRITFLTEEWNAMQPAEEGDDEPQVVLLSIPGKRIRRQMLKQPASRQLAGLGILNQVESTETVSSTELRKTLQQIPASQLVKNLPGTMAGNQNVAAETALERMLVHADRTIGKTCRLVFFNGTWLSEAAAAENQQAMMMQMLTGGLQSQLQQLLNEAAGPTVGSQPKQGQLPNVLPAKAEALATAEAADVVEVRTMQLNPSNGNASVAIAVFWHSDSGRPWKKIASVNAAANQSDVSAESRQRILQDERVKEVTDLFSSLGVNGSQLNSALTMGAVVESASGKAEALLAQQLKPVGTANAKLRVLSRTLPASKN